MIMEILGIWLKIIGIIVAWEIWKWIWWEFTNWWVIKQTEQYERGKRK